MENEEVDPGFDSEIDDEEIWYTDDPVADPKIDWFYKLRSFAPIAILLIVSTIYLPSTVGGKISLNSNASSIEFGQGSALTATCAKDQSISITPSANFAGTVGGVERFSLKGLKVTDIPLECREVTLDFGIYNTTLGVAPYYFMHPSYSRIGVYYDSGTYYTTLKCGISITTDSLSGFTVNFSEPVNVSRDELFLTLESRDKFGTYLNNQSEVVRFDSGDCASYSGSSTTVVNIGSTGASSNGVIQGALGIVTSGVKSNFVFDAVASKKIPFTRAVSADFTLAAWIKISSYPNADKPTTGLGSWLGGYQIIGGDVGDIKNDFGFALLNGYLGFGTGGTKDYTVWSDSRISLNDWHYVAATRQKSDNKVELYVDGVLVGSGTTLSANRDLNASATNVIGADPVNAGPTFSGTIGVVQQYSRILTANEQLNNYTYLNKRYLTSTAYSCSNYGNSCSIGDPGPGGGTVFYYKADGFSCGSDFNATGGPNGSQCHYLEYSASNWAGAGTVNRAMYWSHATPATYDFAGDTGMRSGWLSSVIGEGLQRTKIHSSVTGICSQPLTIPDPVTTSTSCNNAGAAALAYRGGGKSDWYIPNMSELNQLCKYINAKPWTNDSTACISAAPIDSSFTSTLWSSNAQSNTQIYAYRFNTISTGAGSRQSLLGVRPIRAF